MNNQETNPYLQVLGGLNLKNHYHLQYKNLFILAFVAISKEVNRDDLSNVFYAEATNRRSSLRGCINKINQDGILHTNDKIVSLASSTQCDLYELYSALDEGNHYRVRELYRDSSYRVLHGKTVPKKSSSDLESWLEDLNTTLQEKVYLSRITLLGNNLKRLRTSSKQNDTYDLSLIARECLELFPYEIDPFIDQQESYLKAATQLYGYIASFNEGLAAQLKTKVLEETGQELAFTTKQKTEQNTLQVIGAIETSKIAHFKGRERESSVVHDQLQSDVKVIQILGRAGIGKTSFVTKLIKTLTTNATEDSVNSEPNEKKLDYRAIFFTNLDANAVTLMPELIQSLLDEQQHEDFKSLWENDALPNDYLWERLFNHILKDIAVLFIIDNLESHLSNNSITDAPLASFVKVFLNSTHQSKLIITSRYELVSDELIRQPELGTILRLPELSVYESTQLLIDRDDTQGRLKHATQEQLSELVKRCHGIPRVFDVLLLKLKKEPLTNLELLLNSSSIEEVLAEPAKVMLDQLTTSDLLLLQNLAVFNEAVPLAVLLHMNGQDAQDHTLAGLNTLVNSAAIIMDEQQHLSLHPLDRDYLLHKVLPKEPEQLLQLHLEAASYYQSQRKEKDLWLEPNDLSPQLKEFEQLYQAAQLNPSYYNAAAETLSGIEFGYLLSWGKSRDILEKRQRLIGNLTDPMLKGKNFNSLGVACMNLRLFDLAIKYFGLSIYHYRTTKTKLGFRMSYHSVGNLATIFTRLKKFDKAIKLFQYNINLTEKMAGSEDIIEKETYESLAVDYTLIADAYLEAENYDMALTYYEKSLDFFNEKIQLRHPHFYATCHIGLAKTHLQLHNNAKARDFAIAANRTARQNKEHGLTIESLCLKATIESKVGNYQEALDLFNTALNLSSKIGEINLEIDTYAAMYKSFKETKNYATIAQSSLTRGVSLAEQINNQQQRDMFFEA